MDDKLAALRAEYESDGISAEALDADPITQFGRWMDEAIEAGVYQANTTVLATADVHGRPSARAVLLKGVDERGFVFYTNLESRKGIELLSNPWAALCFVWLDLHRQVRIEGPISHVSDEQSDDYFQSRPRDSRIASAASPQSRAVADRDELERIVDGLATSVGDGPVPRPDHWGGVRIRPQTVEFWQGRVHRLHDRIVYERDGEAWAKQRLAP